MYACICVHVYVCMYVQVAAPLAVVALSICTIYVQWVAFLVAHVAALGHVVEFHPGGWSMGLVSHEV